VKEFRTVRVRGVVVVGLVASVSLAACSGATTAAPSYGPVGHRFSIAFTSPPTRETNLNSLTGGAQQQIVQSAYGYQVSSEKDIFSSSAAIPPPPSTGVGIAVLHSDDLARRLIGDLSQSLDARAVSIHGVPGYEKVARESSFRDQGKPSDPSAYEGLILVRQNQTVFAVLCVTTTAAATQAILSSFRIG
jgi:hypothetical protein